jgi:hypothetical protein
MNEMMKALVNFIDQSTYFISSLTHALATVKGLRETEHRVTVTVCHGLESLFPQHVVVPHLG